ncbi:MULTISPECIES: aminotransferase class I/II-fold pyridoxal phosphate-dependent enzyme [Streptomyces]|uniref:aminotransferase class I/II-fold pyridoxal phosphate-dependent enzyme n=1 Tax=Streptomyces TaxID=1883 RepID=UPI000CD5AC99|nr:MULTISPECIES: aminotransferase class I/II-fold pyridoxal phosphate-dependent enzyme [Streptomyces]MCX4713025.1 aminotransferase class I/II-fold pyridoxal phosphate-dependent enzyme [Streptomyces griseus]QXR00649.1 aminotransferase class I/II-fold pyridoxal phosphate-dependent enzyme [Streptomyces sp. WY228]
MARVRVAVYVTRPSGNGPELLSFAHRDFPDAGIQVPAGGVDPGEDLETAARRECMEETGIAAIRDLRALGVDQSPHPATGQDRVTVFFHAVIDQTAPDEWRHIVGGVGTDDGMVFDCRFAPLAEVGPTLVDGQDGFIDQIPAGRGWALAEARDLIERLRSQSDGTKGLPASQGAVLLERSGQVLRDLDHVTVTEIGAHTRASAHPEPSADAVDLSSGNPDPQLLPDAERLAGEAEPVLALYGEPRVLPRFAEAVSAYAEEEGMPVGGLLPLPGGLFAIEYILSTLLSRGDRVAVESPGHQGDVLLLRSLGLNEVPVSVDRYGMAPEALRAVAGDVQAVLIRPRAQNPLGAAVTPERAEELRAALAGTDALVVLEDHCGPVAGAPFVSPVADDHPAVLTVHSFSKWVAPDLRCSVVTGEPFLVDLLDRRRMLGGGWLSRHTQSLVAAALTSPWASEILQNARLHYAARRSALFDALGAHGIEALAESGLNVYVGVGDEERAVTGLAERGWLVSPGRSFGDVRGGIRITVATLAESDTKRLADDIATVGGRSWSR